MIPLISIVGYYYSNVIPSHLNILFVILFKSKINAIFFQMLCFSSEDKVICTECINKDLNRPNYNSNVCKRIQS